MTNISEIISRWRSGEGRPFKGQLIDLDAYNQNPNNIGCMCAQGQILHLIGGFDAQQLAEMAPDISDKETARLLGISRAHAALLRIVNDRHDGCPEAVLENPASIIGDQWQTVLAFWRYLDRMTLAQWNLAGSEAWSAAWGGAWDAALGAAQTATWSEAVEAAWAAARDAAWNASYNADRDAVVDVTGAAARAAAWDAVGEAAGDSAGAAAGATNEIQGTAVMRERGQPFYFLPLFGFADPEAVLASEEAFRKGQYVG